MNYPKVARIDWFRVIVDLERERWSLERIAVAVERSKGWVSNLKNIPGTEPRFHDGLMLLGLWSQVTGKERAAVEIVPIRTRPTPAKGQEPARAHTDTPADSDQRQERAHGQRPNHQRSNPRSADERTRSDRREPGPVFAC